jgi:hypothetical protein
VGREALLGLLAIVVAGCPAAAKRKSTMSESLRVTCAALDKQRVRCQIHNAGKSAVHLLENARMPYFIKEGDSLVILRGVNAPDPDMDYAFIEIPTTVPLAPGATRVDDIQLVPLFLRDHYQSEKTPAAMHGRVTIRFRVGWGETPIVEAHKLSIKDLLAWQHLAEAPPITVDLP